VTHLVNQLRHADAQSAATAGSGLAEKRARFLMQISPDPVVISSAEGIIRYASPSMETVFGQDPDSFIGRNVRTLVTDGSDEAGRQMMQAVVGVPRARVVAELETNLSGGGSRWFEVVATNMLDVEDVHGIVFQARDITDRRELQARLEHMAKTESLTGLLNRRGFLDGLHAWLERRRSDGSVGDDAPVACFIDLDDFKSINDRYGHAAGDAALVAVGNRLAGLIDGRGFVGRMGGDEFVLLAELADEAERDAFIRDLESALHGSVVHGDQEIVFAGSAGTIDLRARVQGTDGASGILRDADHELQRAKTRRRSMASEN
jgi:diguanylate cyclase (GGDEF)-like protein/PAS domain S-box-containing protein